MVATIVILGTIESIAGDTGGRPRQALRIRWAFFILASFLAPMGWLTATAWGENLPPTGSPEMPAPTADMAFPGSVADNRSAPMPTSGPASGEKSLTDSV